MTPNRRRLHDLIRHLKKHVPSRYPIKVRFANPPRGDHGLTEPKREPFHFLIRISREISHEEQTGAIVHEFAHPPSWGMDGFEIRNGDIEAVHGEHYDKALDRVWGLYWEWLKEQGR